MKTRSLIPAVLAVSLLAAAAPAASTDARRPVDWELRYYSGGQLVGLHLRYCDGGEIYWGDMTQIDNEFIWYGCD